MKFRTKLSKTPVKEGQGEFSGIGEADHVMSYLSISRENFKNFIEDVKNYRVLILNKGWTNNELITQYKLKTLTQEQICKEIHFVPVEPLKPTARVLITKACQRNCKYCCNNYKNIMKQMITIYELSQLSAHDEICITGGEPMLNPNRTKKIIEQIKEINPTARLFLYTARYCEELYQILPLVDGLHFTLHANTTENDIKDFYALQKMIEQFPTKSFRLYLFPEIQFEITIIPNRWKRVEVKPWISEEECCLPLNEDLYIYYDRERV